MQSQPKSEWSDLSLEGLDGLLEDEPTEVVGIVDDSCLNISACSDASHAQELISLYARLEKTEALYKEALNKLESASYRIGYLDARIAAYVEQLKLLTADKGYLPRWCRWRAWFISGRKENL